MSQIIRVLLVDSETGKVFRSFDSDPKPWITATALYDRMQKIMDGKPTKDV